MTEWTLRGTHQLQTEKQRAIFITLTYSEKNLPREGYDGLPIVRRVKEDAGGNLRPEDMTKFFKRFRKHIEKNYSKRKIKYIYCGEYGTKRWRPHYHAIIYGITPEEIDEQTIQDIWGLGKVDMSKNIVTEYSIQYTIGYCSKKLLDRTERRDSYYKKGRLPPYLRCSKGIGKDWALKNKETYIDTLKITYKGYEISVPRYYLKLLKKQEGITISYKVKHTTDDSKTKEETRYRTFINPLGKDTKRIFNAQIKQINDFIHEAEENIENDYYFEGIIYQENRIKELYKEEKKRLITWRYVKTHTKEHIQKILYNRYIKKYKDVLDEFTPKKDEYTLLSKEYIKEEQEKALHKVELIMKGAYGKRQKMEEMEELQGIYH